MKIATLCLVVLPILFSCKSRNEKRKIPPFDYYMSFEKCKIEGKPTSAFHFNLHDEYILTKENPTFYFEFKLKNNDTIVRDIKIGTTTIENNQNTSIKYYLEKISKVFRERNSTYQVFNNSKTREKRLSFYYILGEIEFDTSGYYGSYKTLIFIPTTRKENHLPIISMVKLDKSIDTNIKSFTEDPYYKEFFESFDFD